MDSQKRTGADNQLLNQLKFNGFSLRDAIISKLLGDEKLALNTIDSTSNIMMLVDIISYMYQMMSVNLRMAASESMFSDTTLFENANRLARLIGYFAKGAVPYSMMGKTNKEIPNSEGNSIIELSPLQVDNNSFDFVAVPIGKGNNTYKFVLGTRKTTSFTGSGEQFEEFIINGTENSKFISQENVFVKVGNINYVYSDIPLYLSFERSENLTNNISSGSQNYTLSTTSQSFNRFNFFINENENYVLKFGDGLSSAKPNAGDVITIEYIESSVTPSLITPDIITSLYNVYTITPKNEEVGGGGQSETITLTPISKLGGFKTNDSVTDIKYRSASFFDRQNRLVTKEDYRKWILSNDNNCQDVVVQNNWDFISEYYGYLYWLAKESFPTLYANDYSTYGSWSTTSDLENLTDLAGRDFIYSANTCLFKDGKFVDPSDCNTIYFWYLDNQQISPDNSHYLDYEFGMRESIKYESEFPELSKIKNITEHLLKLDAPLRVFFPYVGTNPSGQQISFSDVTSQTNSELSSNISNIMNWIKGGFDLTQSNYYDLGKISITISSEYAQSKSAIKSEISNLIYDCFYSNVSLGKTPDVNKLSSDILDIDGVLKIETVGYNQQQNLSSEGSSNNQNENVQISGFRFLTFTLSKIVEPKIGQSFSSLIGFDSYLSNQLPEINRFEAIMPIVGFNNFIDCFVEIKIDGLTNE